MLNKPGLINEYALFSDFDGTITLKDSTEELVRVYGNEQNKQDEVLFIAGKATNRDVMPRHYSTMKLSPETYYNMMDSIPIDPGFSRFYAAVRAVGADITVLTGSGAQGVQDYLIKKGYNSITVYGNRMEIENGMVMLYPADDIRDTICEKGCCAHCKSLKLEQVRANGKKLIYIGDGLTDICAAKHSDLLFAKGRLADYCENNGIPFIPFLSFDDIYNYFFENQNEKY